MDERNVADELKPIDMLAFAIYRGQAESHGKPLCSHWLAIPDEIRNIYRNAALNQHTSWVASEQRGARERGEMS